MHARAGYRDAGLVYGVKLAAFNSEMRPRGKDTKGDNGNTDDYVNFTPSTNYSGRRTDMHQESSKAQVHTAHQQHDKNQYNRILSQPEPTRLTNSTGGWTRDSSQKHAEVEDTAPYLAALPGGSLWASAAAPEGKRLEMGKDVWLGGLKGGLIGAGAGAIPGAGLGYLAHRAGGFERNPAIGMGVLAGTLLGSRIGKGVGKYQAAKDVLNKEKEAAFPGTAPYPEAPPNDGLSQVFSYAQRERGREAPAEEIQKAFQDIDMDDGAQAIDPAAQSNTIASPGV